MHWSFTCLTLLATIFLGAACARAPEATESSYQSRRADFRTHLVHAGTTPSIPDTLPDLSGVFGDDLPGQLSVVTYPGPVGDLPAWLYLPEIADREPVPGLLFLHAGWRLLPEQQPALRPFIDAGYAVLWPTWRGEHRNPGHYELFLGEVDDAAAAARWLADHPRVDPTRVFGLGWSIGGGISAMLSLVPGIPLRHTASSGGLYDGRGGEHWPRWADVAGPLGVRAIPFDTTRVEEFEMRTLPGNFRWMERKHFAYVETQSQTWTGSISAAQAARARGDTLIEIEMIPGDHFSIFPEVVDRYLEVTERTRE